MHTQRYGRDAGLGDKLHGYEDLKDFVASLEKPRCCLRLAFARRLPFTRSCLVSWYRSAATSASSPSCECSGSY